MASSDVGRQRAVEDLARRAHEHRVLRGHDCRIEATWRHEDAGAAPARSRCRTFLSTDRRPPGDGSTRPARPGVRRAPPLQDGRSLRRAENLDKNSQLSGRLCYGQHRSNDPPWGGASNGDPTGRRSPRLHRRHHRGHDQLPRLPRRRLGRPVLAPEGLHPGLHDRARLRSPSSSPSSTSATSRSSACRSTRSTTTTSGPATSRRRRAPRSTSR